jgi:CHAT domain-containing protein
VAAEQGRGRAIAALIASRTAQVSEPSTNPTLSQIRQVAIEQQATLVTYSILYDTLAGEGRMTQAKASKLFVWVVSPTGNVAFKEVPLAGNASSLEALVENGRMALGARSRAGAEISQKEPKLFGQHLKQLYDLMIAPIESWLPPDSQQSVIFIPQGPLNLVPFATLQDSRGRYLIDRFPISSSPSIQLLALTRQLRQSQGNVSLKGDTWIKSTEALIIGNPTMPRVPSRSTGGGEPLRQLAGAEKEAQAIARLFKTKPLLGGAATEDTIRQQLPQAKLVHFATHGLLDYGTARESFIRDVPGAIAFAPSATADGFLTATELSGMKLQAKLAVLSACDTGRGTITGDGVVGLGRSLFVAGVPSVVVSLWSVPDAPTAELMEAFYGHLRDSGSVARSPQLAMQDIKKVHPDPVDWAAFMAIGQP